MMVDGIPGLALDPENPVPLFRLYSYLQKGMRGTEYGCHTGVLVIIISCLENDLLRLFQLLSVLLIALICNDNGIMMQGYYNFS